MARDTTPPDFSQWNTGAANTAAQQPATPPTGTPSNTTPLATGDAPIVSNQESARERLRAELAKDGLEASADWYYEQLLAGKSEAEIEMALYDRPEVAARYPGLAELRKKGRAISFDQYREIEKQYVSLFRQAGLPEGFYDSADDFGAFIANEVSPQEMAGRLDVARTALYETPPNVRDELARLYGQAPGSVMAFLLDPNKALPIIQQQFTAAAAGAASRMSGYGMLTQAEAESLGATGRDYAQFEEGFDFLGRAQELFQPIIGETGDTITRDEQLQATFQGNTAARRRIEKKARERAAQFAGGGGFASDRAGISGLGSADA